MKKKHVFDKNASLMLKGIAIILLVFHHGFRLSDIYKGFEVSFFPFNETSIINLAQASKICVSMFVFVSGYGLYLDYAKKNVTAQRWSLKRFLKTFSKYWFVWFLVAVICQLINGQTGRLYFADGIDKGIVYCLIDMFGLSYTFNTPTLDSVWWYMGAVLTFILSMPFVYKCRHNLLLLTACVLVLPRILLGHDGAVVYGSGMSAFTFFGEFLIGCTAAECGWLNSYLKYEPSSRIKKVLLLCLELWGIIFLYKLYHHMDRSVFWEIHYIFLPTLCILFLTKYVFTIRYIQKPLIILGMHSMNMFLIHSILQRHLKPFIFSCGHFVLSILVLLLLSMLFSIAINWLINITGYNKFITKILE